MHHARINESLTGLLAVLMAVGPAVAGSPVPNAGIPDGRITELVSVNEAAARALAFIDAVASNGGREPDPADNSTRGWYNHRKSWYCEFQRQDFALPICR